MSRVGNLTMLGLVSLLLSQMLFSVSRWQTAEWDFLTFRLGSGCLELRSVSFDFLLATYVRYFAYASYAQQRTMEL